MRSSLYAQYIEEREGRHILETDQAFATYQFFNDECYVSDIFVVKEARRSRIAWDLLDQIVVIAKANNCRYLTGTVSPSANGSEASLKAHIAYGFKLHSASSNVILFKKEI